ncbi:hypothetical protein AB0J28_48990, partial [Streptosporangium canum]|uniref:hypothetical protein n=1 Tax=Streptosporangium canum TaxID=324952 RepID=UPI00342EF31D
ATARSPARASGPAPRPHARRAPQAQRRRPLTTRAALIYLHTENGRDQMIADGMGKLAEAALKKEDPSGSGT